jgi:hypothetical protein
MIMSKIKVIPSPGASFIRLLDVRGNKQNISRKVDYYKAAAFQLHVGKWIMVISGWLS